MKTIEDNNLKINMWKRIPKSSLYKLQQWFFLVAIFLLPWQTIILFRPVLILGQETQFGSLGFYLVELLIVGIFLLQNIQSCKTKISCLRKPLYLFCAVLFFSLTSSIVFAVSAFHVFHIIAAGCLFLILIDENTNITHVIFAFLFGLILPCVLGWFQFFSGFSPAFVPLGIAQKFVADVGIAVVQTDAFRMLRAYGSFPHPNIFGGYLAVAIFMLGYLSQTKQFSKKWNWIICAMMILFVSTLVITFSRSAWLALGISTIILLIYFFKTNHKFYNYVSVALKIGLITFIVTAIIFHSQVFARMDTLLHVESISITERVNQYKNFAEVMKQNLLFGVGEGSYVFSLAKLFPNQPVYSYQPIHNTWLLMICEIGFVGFFVFAYFIFQIIKPIFKKTKEQKIVLFSFLSLLFILGLFDHYLWSLWSGLALSGFVLGVLYKDP